ncbi:hypothetical protein C8R45DRAFT_1219128 [Mycena sanguinolenta]|nr:hypothetical protein C8R45DRAFT_1219128 [Mycena sanguinolenta]
MIGRTTTEEGVNHRVWDHANTRAPEPILSPSYSSSSPSARPPPAAALRPAMRILKRPSPSSTPTPAPAPAPSTAAALKEKEARYAAARERIFGPGADDSAGGVGNESEREGKGREKERRDKGAGVVRNPKGPSEGEGGGFGGKRRPPNVRRTTGDE